jgi:hypothetical protein
MCAFAMCVLHVLINSQANRLMFVYSNLGGKYSYIVCKSVCMRLLRDNQRRTTDLNDKWSAKRAPEHARDLLPD